jgi:hypothetical protein
MNKGRIKRLEGKVSIPTSEKYIGFKAEGKYFLPIDYLIKIDLDPADFKEPETDFFLYGENYKEAKIEDIKTPEFLILIEIIE